MPVGAETLWGCAYTTHCIGAHGETSTARTTGGNLCGACSAVLSAPSASSPAAVTLAKGERRGLMVCGVRYKAGALT